MCDLQHSQFSLNKKYCQITKYFVWLNECSCFLWFFCLNIFTYFHISTYILLPFLRILANTSLRLCSFLIFFKKCTCWGQLHCDSRALGEGSTGDSGLHWWMAYMAVWYGCIHEHKAQCRSYACPLPSWAKRLLRKWKWK